MQISYLLYDGSAYPKLTPPVSSPYQTTLSLSLSIYLSPSPPSHCIPLFATISLSFPPHPSFPFFLPPPPFFHPFSPTERSAVPRRLRSTRFSHPYLSSPPPIHISTAHTHTYTRLYSLLDSRARSSAFAFFAHAFPTSSCRCTHGVSHLWRMLLSLFMTRTVLILGLASKGLFKGRRTATPGGESSLSLSLPAMLCDGIV